jgi:3-deoxy-D-manno-octulosonic-acid transferase
MPQAAKVILEITNRNLGITRSLLLYRLLQFLALPFIVIYFIYRLLRDKAYRPHFSERLGVLSRTFHRTAPNSIWLHAVSVGEVVSAVPLIKQMRAEHPEKPFYVSSSTIAGRKAAEQQLSSLVNGVFYAPIDFVSCVRRVVAAIRPALLIVLETEIWPNLYAEVKRSGAGVALVNARISDRTWPRYLGARAFFRPILCLPDRIMVQTSTDYSRYVQLGVSKDRLELAGNLKYDAAVTPRRVDLPTFGAKQVWVAASTVGPNERGSVRPHDVDEDDIVIATFQVLCADFPELLLILAPRQPSRFEAVAAKLKTAQVSFIRRRAMQDGHAADLQLPGVLLLDTIGELAGTYSTADVVFVGGSLAPRGGHNILEPAAASAPIIVGPHMENFAAIASDFREASALVQIGSAKDLDAAVRSLLANPQDAKRLGERARTAVLKRSGTAAGIAARLWPIYHRSQRRTSSTELLRWPLKVLSYLWTTGGYWKRWYSERLASSLPPLPAPVVSIGAITVGGSGKTPFTNYLTQLLLQRGDSPAILMRGYRRRYPERNLVLSPGTEVDPAFTGDEAQIFLRSAQAPLGIGANRYETAKILLAQYPETNILLLDDGFQHARLARELDIVLIDGLDPFGGRATVPLGRLREPLEALGRADIFVVTRAENTAKFEAIRGELACYNESAPVFRTRLLAKRWREYPTGETVEVPSGVRVAAFCGLGNPQNYWNTLDSLGLERVFQWPFGDHHSYTPVEIQRIADQAKTRGAELLVTTEKDRINLPDHLERALKGMRLAWLEIELELEDETGFCAAFDNALAGKAHRSTAWQEEPSAMSEQSFRESR